MPELRNQQEFEERIRILEQENEQLAEKAEHSLMLGLVSEAIGQAEDITEMLDVALERISMLKAIPFAACCSYAGPQVTVVHSYLSFSHDDVNAYTFQMDAIKQGALLIRHDATALRFLDAVDIDFRPNQVLLIPFSTQATPHGVYIFADRDHDAQRLENIAPILQRITDVLTISMDNRGLLKSYQALNTELDQRVEARTKALAESEQKYSALVEGSDAAIMLFHEGHFVDCNAATLRMFHCDSKDEFLRLSPAMVSPEFQADGADSATLSMQYIQTAMREGACRFDWIHQRLDGQRFTADIHLSRIDINQQTLIQGVVIDISERVKAEEALRKLSQAVEHAGESMMITDREGIIEYVNPAFTQMSGYESHEAVGQTPRILQSEMHEQHFYEQMWKTIVDGKHWSDSIIERHKNGSLYPVLMSISPILDHAGVITHYIAIQRDMTELTQMEEKFYQAQKMEAIGSLVSGIAHDFNNMLASMIGSMYLIKLKLQEHPDILQRMEALEKQSFQAADMIKQLLAFARKGNMQLQLLSFTSLMKEVFKLIRVSIPENIAVHLSVCDDALKIKGDASLLQQVLMNLMNNARDAIADVAQPEIHVVIDTYPSDAAFVERYPEARLHHRYARLSVRDNGCGIASHDLKKVFEPFYTTKPEGQGTGLGLAMIEGSIQSHAGMIEVDSKLGEDTVFTIYLPLAPDADNPINSQSQLNIMQGKGETILMVDDEEALRTVHAELLNRLGYNVLQADDGVAAVDVFACVGHDIKLVITDVVMPNMGGVDLAKHIWRAAPAMPVIFMTGYDKKHLSDIPADQKHMQVIFKPFSIDVLSQHIHRLLHAPQG